jgi:cell wall-associated NlpC family hydrolase
MAEKYDMKLTNYARPLGWWDAGMNLLSEYFEREGFLIAMIALNKLEVGDLLLMRVANRSGVANHFGVYTGNGYVLHHLYGQKSKADPINERWKGRILDVLRHPDVTAKNEEGVEKVDLMTFLPPHMRERYERAAARNVESVG